MTKRFNSRVPDRSEARTSDVNSTADSMIKAIHREPLSPRKPSPGFASEALEAFCCKP
jgi:hypothetical protein